MIAIISARAGSKRLPGKNKIDFCGVPIIMNTIGVLTCMDRIEQINVKTNDTEIKELLYRYKPNRVWCFISESATDDEATLSESVRYFEYAEDVILVYPTAVLMEIEEINQGIELFNTGKYDVVYPVNKDGSHVGEWFIFNMSRILKGEEILRGVPENKRGKIIKKYEGVDIHDKKDLERAKELYIERLKRYL